MSQTRTTVKAEVTEENIDSVKQVPDLLPLDSVRGRDGVRFTVWHLIKQYWLTGDDTGLTFRGFIDTEVFPDVDMGLDEWKVVCFHTYSNPATLDLYRWQYVEVPGEIENMGHAEDVYRWALLLPEHDGDYDNQPGYLKCPECSENLTTPEGQKTLSTRRNVIRYECEACDYDSEAPWEDVDSIIPEQPLPEEQPEE